MANVRVTIKVDTYAGEKIYICGSTKNLGAWDAAKAEEMVKDENGLYTITKMFPEGQMVEFKFLSTKSWANVEKGMYGEELDNHIVFPSKGSDALIYGVDKFGE